MSAIRDLKEVPSLSRLFPGILQQRVTIPNRVVGYVDRAELVDRAMPTQRRLTVLKASGGFGKTVLLAECCRKLRASGIAAAWLSLDGLDTPDMLDTYIAAACASAGLAAQPTSRVEQAADGAGHRVAVVAGWIQALDAPFVIAFDELEQLDNPACIAMLEFLLRRGPSNLHLAFAGREIPTGLNVADPVLEGRAAVLDAEDLRFSRAEVARFFDNTLSRRALVREANQSAGWPFALRVSRNSGQRESGGMGEGDNMAANWIESRLFAHLNRDDRDLVLDLGLFDWIDEPLLSEVLQTSGVLRHLESISVLEGLIEPVRSGETLSWRLHSLVHDHCARQRFREDAERHRRLHRRIAKALAHRGETVTGMRHAIAGDAPALAGEILEQAGGVRYWTRQGVARFLEANSLLTQDVVAKSPRLKLARCAALMLSGRLHEAWALYAECFDVGRREQITDDATQIERVIDDCVLRHGMALYGGVPLGAVWLDTLIDDSLALLDSPRLDPAARGHFEYALAVRHFLRGEFGDARERLAAVLASPSGSPYIEFYGALQHGQMHLVLGRAQEAESQFRKARRIAGEHLSLDPVAVLSSEVTRRELVLERNPLAATEPVGLHRVLMEAGVPFSFFATAITLSTDTRLIAGRADEIVAVTDPIFARVQAEGRTAFARLLAAIRVSALLHAGHIDEAARVWRRERLPENTAACIDREGQTWREFERVPEARARLLIATERYDEARRLLRQWHAVAAAPSFRKVQLQALALAISLEQRAGDGKAALEHLERYLDLFTEVPYVWALVRERDHCADVVGQYVEARGDTPHGENAKLILVAMRRVGDRLDLSLTDRQLEVLRLLPDNPVKSIANSLGLTAHGVRYHLRKLFTKLGASNREELLRRARELELLPG